MQASCMIARPSLALHTADEQPHGEDICSRVSRSSIEFGQSQDFVVFQNRTLALIIGLSSFETADRSRGRH